MLVLMTAATFPLAPPSWDLFGAEPWRAAKEFVAHYLNGETERARRGDGHPVIIFPGLGTDGSALVPLRDRCRSLGFHTRDWELGLNSGPQGDIDAWLRKLATHTAAMLDGQDQSATLIGWSLGGIYAREIAKLLGGRVRQVITIAAPFNSTTDQTNVGRLLRMLNGASCELPPALSKRLRKPPGVPTTSIYSRTDGMVAWQSCRHDKGASLVQDIEVEGCHLGMMWNPAVLRVIGDRLAQQPGAWRPYR